MNSAIVSRLRGRPISMASAAGWWLSLASGCLFAFCAHAGVVPNSDGEHSDNGTNDPYYINAGNFFTYIRVYDDDVLVMNGGTISNLARPQFWWRSPIRLLDQSRAVINGGLIQDVDTTGGTWGLHLEDHSR